jgi:hypothetical protein
MLRAKCGCDEVPTELVERIRRLTVTVHDHPDRPSA